MLSLLTAASAADGVRPVSEETELRLQHGGPPGGRDVLAEGPDGALLGYARLDPDGEAAAELVVAPGARGAGVGTALLAHVERLAGDRPVSVWAHGDLPAAAALAGRRGYRRDRVLLQMRRDLAGVDPDPHPALPAAGSEWVESQGGARPVRTEGDFAALVLATRALDLIVTSSQLSDARTAEEADESWRTALDDLRMRLASAGGMPRSPVA